METIGFVKKKSLVFIADYREGSPKKFSLK